MGGVCSAIQTSHPGFADLPQQLVMGGICVPALAQGSPTEVPGLPASRSGCGFSGRQSASIARGIPGAGTVEKGASSAAGTRPDCRKDGLQVGGVRPWNSIERYREWQCVIGRNGANKSGVEPPVVGGRVQPKRKLAAEPGTGIGSVGFTVRETPELQAIA